MEWSRLERTFKGHLVQPFCNEQGYLPLEQLAQNPIQPDHECFQGWSIHQLPGNEELPLFYHPHNEKFLITPSLNPSTFSLKPFLLVLSEQALLRSPPTFLISPLWVLKGCKKVSLWKSFLLSRLSPNFPSTQSCSTGLHHIKQRMSVLLLCIYMSSLRSFAQEMMKPHRRCSVGM